MTPQERQLVEDLFERLARLESAPRDAEAERTIAEGLRRAPNAIYPLVQTVLVQDEALKRADARIRELTGEDAEVTTGGGFLDNMRQALTGRSGATSVPSVRPGAPDPRWNSGGAPPNTYAAPPGGGSGGSVLGTAAAQLNQLDVRSPWWKRFRGRAARRLTVGQQRIRKRSGARRRHQRRRRQWTRRLAARHALRQRRRFIRSGGRFGRRLRRRFRRR
jgi:hypothetical protein